MTDFLNNLFSNLFGDNVVLATILIAMVPIIELRGAIPFATSAGFWGVNALNNWTAFAWSLLGSSVIVPIVALIFIPLINWLKRTKLFGRLARWIENRVKSKAEVIEKSDSNADNPPNLSEVGTLKVGEKNNLTTKSSRFTKTYWKKVLAVFLFVAIPLPLTGVWTGTCVAVFLGLDYLTTCVTVISGNVIAGLLITLILQFFPALNDYLFYIFILLVVIVILFELIKNLIKKKKNQKTAGTK